MIRQVFRIANCRRAYYYCRKNGILPTFYACLEKLQEKRRPPYQKEGLSAEERRRQQETVWEEKPLISLLVPVYETDAVYFREMLESVRRQTYPHWELILADASSGEERREAVERFGDGRIRYLRLPGNCGISQNSNEALRAASGAYIGLLDHDDVLEENALYEVAAALAEARRAGKALPELLYSDEDKADERLSRFYEPHYKEKFNLDLLLSNNYICHFMVMKAGLMKELGFRREYDGAQDYDLVLRAAARLRGEPEKICHIPRVLYHWRCHEASTAENPQSKMYAYEAGRRAVADFCEAQGWQVQVSHTRHLGFYRVSYLPDVFSQRPEVAAVGGSVICRGRIVGGAAREDGRLLYGGLFARFDGYLHRASLCQDVEALDGRSIRVRREQQETFARICESEPDLRKAGLLFSRRMRSQGFLLLWDPQLPPAKTAVKKTR